MSLHQRSRSPIDSADPTPVVFPRGYEEGFVRPGFVAERVASFVLQCAASASVSSGLPGFLCGRIATARGIHSLLPPLQIASSSSSSSSLPRRLFVRTSLLQSASQIANGIGGGDDIVQPEESISPATSRRSILHRGVSLALNEVDGSVDWSCEETEVLHSADSPPENTFVCRIGGGGQVAEAKHAPSTSPLVSPPSPLTLEWASLHGYLLIQLFEERPVGEAQVRARVQPQQSTAFYPERHQNVVVGQCLLRICDLFASSTSPHTVEDSELCRRLSDTTRTYEDERSGEMLPPAQEFLLRAWLPLSSPQTQTKKQSAKHTPSSSSIRVASDGRNVRDTRSFVRPLSRALSPQAAARRAAAIAAAAAAAASAPAVLVEISLVLPPGIVVGEDLLRLHERTSYDVHSDHKNDDDNNNDNDIDDYDDKEKRKYRRNTMRKGKDDDGKDALGYTYGAHISRSTSPGTKSLASSHRAPVQFTSKEVPTRTKANSIISSSSSSYARVMGPSPFATRVATIPRVVQPTPRPRPATSSSIKPSPSFPVVAGVSKTTPGELLKFVDDLKGLVKGMEKQVEKLKVDVQRSSGGSIASSSSARRGGVSPDKQQRISSPTVKHHQLSSLISQAAGDILRRDVAEMSLPGPGALEALQLRCESLNGLKNELDDLLSL